MDVFKASVIVLLVASLVVNLSESSPVKKELHQKKNGRCKRFGEGAAFFVSLGVALGRINEIIAVENYPVKQQYPHWTESSSSPSPTSSPRTTPTPSPSRTPTPSPSPSPLVCPVPDRNFDGVVATNYDLTAFAKIPRTFFRFVLEPLPHTPEHVYCWNGEYMLFDANFIAAASPDAVRNRVIYDSGDHLEGLNAQLLRPIQDSEVSSTSFWDLTERINLGLDAIRSLTTRIHTEVDQANAVLYKMQKERFVARMDHFETHYRWQRSGGYGIPPAFHSNVYPPTPFERDDWQLNEQFLHQARRVARLIDRRGLISYNLLEFVRRRDCVLYGENMKSHAKTVGVVGLPKFSIQPQKPKRRNGYLRLNEEEAEWIRNPTNAWFPRQSPIDLTVRTNVEDAPADQQAQRYYHHRGVESIDEFQAPSYPTYLVLPGAKTPGFPERLHGYYTTDVHIGQSSNPQFGYPSDSDYESSHSDSDHDSGSDHDDDDSYDYQMPQSRVIEARRPSPTPAGDEDPYANPQPGPSGQGRSASQAPKASKRPAVSQAPALHDGPIYQADPAPEVITLDESDPEELVVQELNRTQDLSSDSEDEDGQCEDIYMVKIKRARLQKRHDDARVEASYCIFSGNRRFSLFMKLFPPENSPRRILFM
jgi:hypothetical protein